MSTDYETEPGPDMQGGWVAVLGALAIVAAVALMILKRGLGVVLLAVALAGAAMAAPVPLAWGAPTGLVSTNAVPDPIPESLKAMLRYKVWSQNFGDTNQAWVVRGSTASNETSLVVEFPPGAFILGVTAQFLDEDWTRSDMSDWITHDVFSKIVTVPGFRVLIVGED